MDEIPPRQTAHLSHDGETLILTGVGVNGPFRCELSEAGFNRLFTQALDLYQQKEKR